MSFFERLTETAKKAKRALDDSGVIEDLGDLVKEAGENISSQSSDASASPQPGESPRVAGDAEIQSVLSLDEVAEITGLPFDTLHPHNDEEWAGGIYQCSDREVNDYFELRYGKAPEGEEYDPNDMWQFLVTEVQPQIPVTGLTEGAFRSSDEIVFFRAGNNVYHTAGKLGDDMADLMVALANRAVENLSK